MQFKEILALLPSIDTLSRATFTRRHDQAQFELHNQPGQAGSLAVYVALARLYGVIDARAAAMGLHWYAEHTQDALAHPGKHPNIDRLLALKASTDVWEMQA